MDRRFKVVTEQISARLAPTSIPAAPLQLWELHGLFSQFLRIEGTTFFLAKGHTFQRPRRLLHKKRPAFQKPQRFVAEDWPVDSAQLEQA